MSSSKPYKLPKVAIRMVKEPPLYSSKPVNRPSDAVRLVRELLQSYDREAVVIVNLDTRAKPINFNIVSVGTLSASLAHPREIMKSAVLSNAASVMLIHNHPSGSIEPSTEDIRLTNNMYSVCRILEIPLGDHIIIGDHERYYSFAEHNLFRYEPDFVEDITENDAVKESHGAYDAVEISVADPADTAGSAAAEKTGKPDWMAARQQAIKEITEKLEQGEISIKFGAGLTEPFTAKDGREFLKISIPNRDPADKTPWASFVLPAKTVHENKFGKGLWAKIPADGTTVVSKPIQKGTDEAGRRIWEDVKSEVPNRELKSMVEAYKTRGQQERQSEPRESAREKLDTMVKSTAEKLSGDKKPKARPKAKNGPEL